MASAANLPVNLGYRLPKTTDTNLPQTIIFREIAIDWSNPNQLNIVYLNYGAPPIIGNIAAFIDSQTPYIQTNRTGAAPVDPTSPLDLHCKQDCFIVFKLSTDDNWHFSTKGDCFTTKRDYGRKYSDLWCVFEDDRYVDGDLPMPERCRLIFFRARGTPFEYKDGFNLRIDLDLGTATVNGQTELRRTSIVIDPDIRFPGGSGS